MKRLALLFVIALTIGCSEDVFVTPTEEFDSGPYEIIIQTSHAVALGSTVEVDISLSDRRAAIGGYSLLITYDASAITFQGAKEGELLTRCGWEYFSYRDGARGDCSGGCPSGLVSLTAIAETNNGPTHPIDDCAPKDVTMATLSFFIPNDRTLSCRYISIRFFWVDCTDNTLADQTGQDLFMAAAVYDNRWATETLGDLYPDVGLPTYIGTTAECDPDEGSRIYRQINFYNGGIDIECHGGDSRGDLNLDGLANRMADAVMYSNYFIEGMEALVYVAEPNQYGYIPGYTGSVAASDVNADGTTLTLADFVYLVHSMRGDELPRPSRSDTVSAQLTISSSGILSIDKMMEAASVVLAGETRPILLADNMELKYGFDGENTRVLVYDFEGSSFSGGFLRTDGEIISVELATPEGKPVRITYPSNHW